MTAPCDRCARLEAALREARQAFEWIWTQRCRSFNERDAIAEILSKAPSMARDEMRAIDKALAPEGKP
jgi:hypothetical protein